MSAPPTQPNPGVQMKLGEALKRGQTHFANGETDQAERYALAILSRRPKHPLANQLLAAIAEKRGQRERVVEILKNALTGTSADALTLMNLCRSLRLLERFDEAVRAGEQAVAIGTLPDALVDLADAYTAMGERARARQFYEMAASKCPDLPRARLGLAQALLLDGEYRAGWSEYEWRYKMPGADKVLPKFKQPQWNGMALTASRLLIIAEQGYGDCFQFARYLPMVCERVKDVFIGAGPEINALLRTAAPSAICYERWEEIPPFDFQITLSSLPLVFGTTLKTIPAATPYLAADPMRTTAWRHKLQQVAQGRKTVGFVWQGRPTHPNDRRRSLALGYLTPLIEQDDVLPVSLQIGAGREQLMQSPLKSRVFDAGDALRDFSETAALIGALDRVVSIDSAIAHLTGALGRPGFVMLPKAGEWRWLNERSDSPWYPSLELVRQQADGDWSGVVQRIVTRLRA